MTKKDTDRLSEQEAMALGFITGYIHLNERPPTFQEIARALGASSPNTGRYHAKRLEEKGHIEIRPNEARAIRVIKK